MVPCPTCSINLERYLFEGVLKKLQELQQALDQAKLKAKILDWMLTKEHSEMSYEPHLITVLLSNQVIKQKKLDWIMHKK